MKVKIVHLAIFCLLAFWVLMVFKVTSQVRERHENMVKLWPVVFILFSVPICHVLGEHEHKSNTHDINDTVFKHRIHDISVAILGILHDWFSSSYHCSIRLFDEQNEVEVCGVWCRDRRSRRCVSDVKIFFGPIHVAVPRNVPWIVWRLVVKLDW